MSERDAAGRAIERAAKKLLGVRDRLNKKFPLGPSQVRLSPKEFRETVQRASPDVRATIIEKVGMEAYLRMMAGPTRPLPDALNIDQEPF